MAAKTKTDTGLGALKAELGGETLRPLYLFWGEEDYLREHYLTQIKKQLLPEGLEEFNYARFDGRLTDLGPLEDAIDALPVFSPKKLIEVRDFDFYKASADIRDRLDALLGDLPDYCTLVFVLSDPAARPDSRMKIHGRFKGQGPGLSVEFEKQDQSDLITWVRRRFQALGKGIDRSEAEYLIFFCGGLMTGLISEIDKIAAYAEGGSISRADIEAVGSPVLDAVVFKLTDALGERDFDLAAKIMGELLLMRESPIMILAVVGKQLRQLLSARLALDSGLDAAYLKNLWGMRSDYPARRLMTSARRFSLSWCRGAVLLAADTDRRMKSTGLPGEQLIVELLIRLASDGAAHG